MVATAALALDALICPRPAVVAACATVQQIVAHRLAGQIQARPATKTIAAVAGIAWILGYDDARSILAGGVSAWRLRALAGDWLAAIVRCRPTGDASAGRCQRLWLAGAPAIGPARLTIGARPARLPRAIAWPADLTGAVDFALLLFLFLLLPGFQHRDRREVRERSHRERDKRSAARSCGREGAGQSIESAGIHDAYPHLCGINAACASVARGSGSLARFRLKGRRASGGQGMPAQQVAAWGEGSPGRHSVTQWMPHQTCETSCRPSRRTPGPWPPRRRSGQLAFDTSLRRRSSSRRR